MRRGRRPTRDSGLIDVIIYDKYGEPIDRWQELNGIELMKPDSMKRTYNNEIPRILPKLLREESLDLAQEVLQRCGRLASHGVNLIDNKSTMYVVKQVC